MNVDSRESRSKYQEPAQGVGLSSVPGPRRVFLKEPGWRVGHKVGSERSFCYMMAPGQDYYHRLVDGELFVYHGDERICLACAERRGLLSFEPRILRQPLTTSGPEVLPGGFDSAFDLKYLPGDEDAG